VSRAAWNGRTLGLASFVAVALVLLTAVPALAQTPGCIPTSGRIVAPHSFKGLVPRPFSGTYTDATQFVTGDGESLDDPFVQRFLAAIQSEGFVSGRSQLFNPPKRRKRRGFGGQALSTTIQLGGEAQAASEAAREYQVALSEAHWKHFSVGAIPGSVGLLQPVTRKYVAGASNVYFSDGPYSYLVGEAPRRGTGYGAVVAAAKRLYLRVHGAPVCP